MRITPEEPVTLEDLVSFNFYLNANRMREREEMDKSLIHQVMTRCSSYFKARNVIARILNLKRRKVDKIDEMNQDQTKAEALIFKHYQAKEKEYVDNFRGHIYYKTEEDG